MRSDNKDNRDANYYNEAKPIVLNIKGETKKPKEETKDRPKEKAESTETDDFLSNIKEAINGDEEKPKKERIKLIPDSIGLGLAIILVGFAEALFLFFVLALDVIPFKYVLATVGGMALIDIIILYLLSNDKKGTAKRTAGLIVAILMMMTLLGGDYYMYSTYDTLQKISKARATWEYYYVISTKDGQYQSVNDIHYEEVNVVKMESKQLNEAKERLVTKANVTYDEKETLLEAAETLVDEKGKTDDEILMISKSQYKAVCQHIDGYKGKTQVIYKIKVKRRADDNTGHVDVTKDSFNILISGLDSWGDIEEGGLSDVNMVMTVNPSTRHVLLTSIPRDSYIPLHSYGAKDKLTHTGIYGEEETKKTIEDFLGIKIDFTVRVNFSTLDHVIDSIDGIDIYSKYDFKSAISDHEYHKGWNHVLGKAALYFARERKAFKDGDMQRNRHQQVVLSATLKKITESKVILTRYNRILDAVEDEIWMSMSSNDVRRLVKMQLNDMKSWTIEKANVVGSTGGAPCYSMGNRELSVVFPSEESVTEVKEKIHDVMYPVDNTVKKDGKNDNEKNKEKN